MSEDPSVGSAWFTQPLTPVGKYLLIKAKKPTKYHTEIHVKASTFKALPKKEAPWLTHPQLSTTFL